MNAVLQCLSHTDILAEYFVLNQYKVWYGTSKCIFLIIIFYVTIDTVANSRWHFLRMNTQLEAVIIGQK